MLDDMGNSNGLKPLSQSEVSTLHVYRHLNSRGELSEKKQKVLQDLEVRFGDGTNVEEKVLPEGVSFQKYGEGGLRR